jgi:hypothetical protein
MQHAKNTTIIKVAIVKEKIYIRKKKGGGGKGAMNLVFRNRNQKKMMATKVATTRERGDRRGKQGRGKKTKLFKELIVLYNSNKIKQQDTLPLFCLGWYTLKSLNPSI